MKKVILVVGVPGSGKTWICEQLSTQYSYIPHDSFRSEVEYTSHIAEIAEYNLTVLAEAPFGISSMIQRLESDGMLVHPVFIIEDEDTIYKRYTAREGKEPTKGWVARQSTYRQRAEDLGAFQGTAQEVLNYLKGGM